jgi:GNAT superfamily N-acetyltransferase
VRSELTFRRGRSSDLRATFALAGRLLVESGDHRGVLAPVPAPEEESHLEEEWLRQRPLLEFIAGQPDGSFWVCESGEEIVGYARVSRFGEMDELSELAVSPEHAVRGVSRELLERCWPKPPSRELGRVVLTPGTPADLSLYTGFGVMPVAGHWQLRHRPEEYLERRSLELVDASEPSVHALTGERAVAEWKRLEPPAIGHERPRLHDFFGRTRSCLARMDGEGGQALALCWVSPDAEIGPAVAATPEHLVPVVLAALDRVAKAQEPETLGIYCTTDSWWLLDHLRKLGFSVSRPSWLMSSVPLPGLDRYLPTRPALLL